VAVLVLMEVQAVAAVRRVALLQEQPLTEALEPLLQAERVALGAVLARTVVLAEV
jgi:hypothetical protein